MANPRKASDVTPSIGDAMEKAAKSATPSIGDAMEKAAKFVTPSMEAAIKGMQLSSDFFKSIDHLWPGSSFLAPETLALVHLADFGSANVAKTLELQDNISAIRKEVLETATGIDHLSPKKQNAKVEQLQEQLTNLEQKVALAFLLGSVTDLAHEALFNGDSIKDEFFDGAEKLAFVVSVDIRRSTELMLKARSSIAFSAFITQLCDELITIFKSNFGVVDKFTGDGILVFFPEFFSGADAGYFALKACTEAISAFENCYRKFRSSFTTILMDVGIGMGVDYGSVHILKMAGSLTVIGQPVVYACRLGGAPAGHIYFNQPAYERISESYSHVTHCVETELPLKHEGPVLCYDISFSSDKHQPKPPNWICNDEQSEIAAPE